MFSSMFNQTESADYDKLKSIVPIVLKFFASLHHWLAQCIHYSLNIGISGIVVSIAAFQAGDPGSIPGRRIAFCDFSFLLSCSLNERKSSKYWITFTSGDSAKEKCFQSRV